MRHVAANVLTILVVLGLVLVGAVLYAQSLFRADGPLAENRIVEVKSGADLGDISEMLLAEGVIDNAALFRIGVRTRGQAAALKAAEYEIPAGASMEQVLAMIVSGRGVERRITIPEGLTTFEILEIVRASELLSGEITLTPAEGVLLPETYNVTRGQSRDGFIRRLMDEMEALRVAEWEGRDAGLPVTTWEEALILASIVEKETGVLGERPQVASVFVNRLRRGMKLQTDPTVIYGVTKGEYRLDRGLRRSELDAPTPWNTYVIDGLPPTPIANPGKAAIMAVLHPATTDFLYFVADGSGGHAFARTLAEHNDNVARWRAIERQGTGN